VPNLQRELDVLPDSHVLEQRIILKHQPNAAVARGHVRHVLAVQCDAAMIDAGEPGDRAEKRRLTAAARSKQYEKFALRDFQRDVIDDGRALIPLSDLIQCDRHRLGTLTTPRYKGQSQGGDKVVTALAGDS
jgi:hypothetical protein